MIYYRGILCLYIASASFRFSSVYTSPNRTQEELRLGLILVIYAPGKFDRKEMAALRALFCSRSLRISAC
jgi:hypothetical protein